jgi:hypothetical protein
LARSDPSIRLLANELAPQAPELVRTLSEKQRVVATGPGGRTPGYMRGGEFVAESRKGQDGSLFQATPKARYTLDRILQKQGYDSPFRTDALARLVSAAENERVEIAPGIEVVKWEVTGLQLCLNGPLMNPIVPVKIAYEFLACHLGNAVYESDAPLVNTRQALLEGDLDSSWISVDRLEAKTLRPIHGIVFEGNTPHATVQVRFFGKLAFRVHFRRLAVGGPRAQYTHLLTDNREWLSQVKTKAASA